MPLVPTAIESLEADSITIVAAKRILAAMRYSVSNVRRLKISSEKVEVIFLLNKQPCRIRLTREHFLQDYFRQRWEKSFDYEAQMHADGSVALLSQGGRAPEYWVKVHGPGRYECDCPDWISQYSARGFALCKHSIRLAYLQEVSLAEMIEAQTKPEQVAA